MTRVYPARGAVLGFLLAVCLWGGGCIDHTTGGSHDPDGDGSPEALDGDICVEDEEDLDADNDADGPPSTPPWAITVIGTDYVSTSVSLISRESRSLFRENIIHSGSSSPGLSVALSGDVVFPRTWNHKNWIVLLDRYPNSVLTFVDPNDFNVIGQLSVATGFASNPHDFLWLWENKAYVTRYETNPRPGNEPYDGGDDILIVDPVARTITGRIPLAGYADTAHHPQAQARPDQMTYADGRVWVTLDHLTNDFEQSGEGRVVAIDPQTDEVVALVRLPEVTNCTGMAYNRHDHALYLSCSGLFVAGTEAQLTHSGIVAIDLKADPPQARVVRRAQDGVGRPYGFDLDVAQGRHLLAVRFGDLETGIPDRLVAIDLETAEETVVHEAGSAYGMGGLLADDATNTVYVGEADPANPAIFLYVLKDGAFCRDGMMEAHPRVGLPPRHIRFY